ncbi:uncharacterized protein K452DRAFT_287182 [Aplosporella prunicola CBS 121167]|uniref:Uncharacterized protein n=1 Tax=Aplosporella prunicola CBS 121167 TaxID=1176127 RepID=A0A6A6BD35_9PEZI|nr:uncharacterized protein K452DRAFT_287182 [Aplosporella prunicola CBS 121167]KAF2141986.1 hypothetical protein K452DRAFT_287182 [Aplosporella prunicola CBS 121167]
MPRCLTAAQTGGVSCVLAFHVLPVQQRERQKAPNQQASKQARQAPRRVPPPKQGPPPARAAAAAKK